MVQNNSTRQNRPIFIVGCPRSGTGILHQLLRLHPDVAWITPVTTKALGRDSYFFERPATARLLEGVVRLLPASWLPEAYQGPFDGSLNIKGIPETSEGHAIWNSYCPVDPHHHLTEDDVTPEAREYFRYVVRWHCEHFRRPRFVNKTPRNILRMRYLSAIFPDAFFVHLVRDGRAVAASILGRRRREGDSSKWWGAKPPGWQKMLSEPVIVQCAWMWQHCLRIGRESARQLNPNQYHELSYEELTERPNETLIRLLRAVDLPDDNFFTAEIQAYLETLDNRNERWRERLTAEDEKLLLRQLERAEV